MKKRASSALALAGATALWLTLDQTTQPPSAPQNNATVVQTYLQDATHWSYTPLGPRRHTLHVLEAHRLAGDTDTQLTSIDFSGRDNQQREWRAKAGAGIWREGLELLQLDDGVTVDATASTSQLTIPRLDINMQTQIARSDAAMELTTADSVTNGRGLRLDLKGGLVEILADVETRYVP